MPEQTKLFFWNNQNLFSNNYLEHHLPTTALWTEQRKKIKDIFETIKKSYETIQALKLGQGQEAELEGKFIRPVLTALGYEYSIQPVTKRGFKKKRPDYALFKDSKAIKAASADKENRQKFFSQALTILESKYWNRRLNDSDKNDILDSRDPTAQTVKYLEDVHLHTDGKINWAILTNGKHWRLFYHKAASRSGNYFEIDLEEIITSGDTERFLYFYLFFSKDAFIPDSVTGRTWLDQHLKGTEEYAVRVSTKLKDLIFDKVFEGLAEGFVHYRMSELSIAKETEDSKKDIFKGCLTLLYRMLFLLYAESRNLLPVEDSYGKVSLSKLRKDIDNDIRTSGLDKMSKRSYVYWARLEGLSGIIANGDSALNVPVYNGGLFETMKDSFLSIHKMPDPFLAEAIKLLTVDIEGEYIDYSSLSVRHLGDIYEGLLEFHVQIADQEMVEVKEKGKLLWKKASELKEDKVIGRKQIGDVYIENSKHERKATGSYYTPHYIVEYIVKNTVGSVLDEKLTSADKLLTELEDANKALHRQRSSSVQAYRAKIREIEDKIFDSIFGISVLDPAMGSGHFLVHTVDFISDRIVSFLAGYPENPVIRKIHELREEILAEIKRQGVRIDESKLTEVNLIKRMVMKRCIYGVDLNDMAVELAKLSLWLDSFTLGAPLSFLDHHLKCGNSLIGTNIKELEKALTGQLFAINLEPLKRAIRDMIFVSDLPDATMEQVRESYKKFGEANRGLEGYRILLDMLIAEHFGIPKAKDFLILDAGRIDLNKLKDSMVALPEKDRQIITQVEAVSGEKRFFHWEIEFPEVFYEKTAAFGQKIDKKENSGFDCVIGNPPWGAAFSFEEKDYFKEEYNNVHLRAPESANYFIGFSSHVANTKGVIGYIVPNVVLYQHEFQKTREMLLKDNAVLSVLNLGDGVFEDVTAAPCCILVWLCGIKPDAPFDKFYYQDFRNVPKDILELNFNAYLQPSLFTASSILEVEGVVFQSNTSSLSVITKASRRSVKLGDISSEVAAGIGTGGDSVYRLPIQKIKENKIEPGVLHPVLVGGEIDPYNVPEDSGYFILYITKDFDPKKYPRTYSYLLPHKEKLSQKREAKKGLIPWYSLHWPRNPDLFKAPKIICRQTADTLIAAVDDKGYYVLNSIIVIHISDTKYSRYYIVSLLNSKLIRYIYENLTQEEDRVFAEVKPINLRKLPITRISFTTPEKERKEFFKEAVKLYERSKYEDIIKWADYELALGRTDTSHDFLAYLAEQMIELNKAKGNEAKGFVKWLEREIGAEIDALANKTAIKEYHDHDYNHLLDVLKKNKNKLTIDPSDRKKQELLEKYFVKSLSILEPLKDKIKSTDNLINQIVYKLYGLTEEEVKIVEGKVE